MDSIALLIDLAGRAREAAGVLDATPPDRVNAHLRGQDNSIAWLLWHAARQMDEQVCALSGEKTVWTNRGFDTRFDLGLACDDMGYGHTAEQARRVVVEAKGGMALLLEHLDAVTQAQIAYLRSLEADALADVVDDAWDPPVTRGARLVSVNADALEHAAQAAFLAHADDAAFE